MLPQAHRAYAATCQTIGLNAGYFLSFTVYLALASADAWSAAHCDDRHVPACVNSLGVGACSNAYLRVPWGLPPQPLGVVTLSGALAAWALLYVVVTVYVALRQHEDVPEAHVGAYTPRAIYGQLWQICRLPRTAPPPRPQPPSPAPSVQPPPLTGAHAGMWLLMAVLLTHRLAFAVNDRVTAFKLLELGFRQEHLAMTALVDFPLEVLIGVYATRYASSHRPLRPVRTRAGSRQGQHAHSRAHATRLSCGRAGRSGCTHTWCGWRWRRSRWRWSGRTRCRQAQTCPCGTLASFSPAPWPPRPLVPSCLFRWYACLAPPQRRARHRTQARGPWVVPTGARGALILRGWCGRVCGSAHTFRCCRTRPLGART
jgi:hypothetical protein